MIIFIILLIVLLPYVYSNEIYDGVNVAKELFFYLIGAVILFYFAFEIWNKKEFKIALPDILLVAFVAIAVISYKTGHGVNGQQKSTMYLFGLIVYFFGKSMPKALYPFLLFILMLGGIGQAIIGLLQLYGIVPSLNAKFQITGTFVNTPMFAMYLGAVFPISLYYVLFKKGKTDSFGSTQNSAAGMFKILKDKSFEGKINKLVKIKGVIGIIQKNLTDYLAFLTMITILVVLPVTMNRTSWLMVIASSCCLLFIKYKKHWRSLQLNARKTIVTASLLIGIIGLTGVYYIKKDSADGRLFIYKVALEKAMEKPIFGHGTGSFEAQYNSWQAEWFKAHPNEAEGREGWLAGNVKFAYHELLEILSENGIIGLLCIVVVLILAVLFSRCNKLMPILAVFIAILLSSFVSYPFRSTPLFLIFFLALGLLPLTKKNFTQKLKSTIVIPLFALISIWSFLGIFIIGEKVIDSYQNYYIWDEAYLLYSMNDYEEAVNSYAEIYPNFKNNGDFLVQYGKALSLLEEYGQSVLIFERAKPYISDIYMFSTLGDNYKVLGDFRRAEKAYRSSYFMVPHRIYPEYLLAKMHMENGEAQKAIFLANKIINKKVKVPSQAVEQIKDEMRKMLKN